MTTKDAATERPWRAVEEYEDGPLTFVTDTNRHPVADCEGEANAALIVEAVNSHDSLLAKNADLITAIEPFVRHYEPWMERMADDDQMSVFARHTMGELRRARAAIGKARTSADRVGGSPVAPKKIVCHASGDRCLGCAHYHGRAPACDFAGVAK